MKNTLTYFFDGSTEQHAQDFCKWLEDAEPQAPHTVYVSSSGGSIDAAFLMVNAVLRFKERGGRIVAYVVGGARSSAVNVVQVCSWRRADPGAFIVIHPIVIDLCNASGTELRSHQMELDLAVTQTATLLISRMGEGLSDEERQSISRQVTNCLYGTGPTIAGNAVSMYLAGLLDEVVGMELKPRHEILAQMRGKNEGKAPQTTDATDANGVEPVQGEAPRGGPFNPQEAIDTNITTFPKRSKRGSKTTTEVAPVS